MNTEFSTQTTRMMIDSLSHIFVVPTNSIGQVLFHGLILSFIIMGFWLLDSLKDPIIANFLGMEYQPTAKLFSVLATLILVCIYDYLTSVLSKSSLFHLISFVFGIIFLILSGLMSDPNIGLSNTTLGPYRYIAWFFYFSVEAYGSLMVAMFWSYTNTLMDLEQAKGAYGLIIAIAQIGAIIGATLAVHADSIGIPQLVLLGSMIILSVSLLVKMYMLLFKHKIHGLLEEVVEHTTTYTDANAIDRTETEIDSSPTHLNTLHKYTKNLYRFVSGFYEGIVIISTYSYTLHLLALSCIYEVVITILDYEFKLRGANLIASSFRPSPLTMPIHTLTDDYSAINVVSNVGGELVTGMAGPLISLYTNNMTTSYPGSESMIYSSVADTSMKSENQFANLMGHFGQLTNFLSLLISLFGFTAVVRRAGVRVSLLIFPVMLFVAVIVSHLFSSLNVLFVVVSVLKALIFSLNEPVKELLYIPTSQPIKYKAKAWIDVFGSRLAKALGSFVTNQSGGNISILHSLAEFPSILLSAGLIVIALRVGRDFEYYVNQNIIVGSELEVDGGRSSRSLDSLRPDYAGLPERRGLKPGDVGYDGYDLRLFEGVFEEEDDEEEQKSTGGLYAAKRDSDVKLVQRK